MNIQEAAREAITQRDFLMNACIHAREKMIERATWAGADDTTAKWVINKLPNVLKESELVIWASGMYGIATKDSEDAFTGTAIPQHISSLTRPQFWYLADDDGVVMNDPKNYWELPVKCMSWSYLIIPDWKDDEFQGIAGMRIFKQMYISKADDEYVTYLKKQPMNILLNEYKEGRFFRAPTLPFLRLSPAAKVGDSAKRTQSLFLACLEFMRLQIAAKTPVVLPRYERRRAQREGKSLPSINVIQLRKREPSGWHTQTEREYQHQWIVKGHWRRLHEPRKKDGAQVTFVDSYVKGPEGKPLLPPRETIFAVTR
jgi:hypothetical protein